MSVQTPLIQDAHAFPDDPEVLPEGSVIEGEKVSYDIEDVADYVVVGSGAAGASAAVVLAGAGYSVALIEEGAWVRTRQFGIDVYPAMKQMFREMGTSMTLGRAMFPVLQGRCVGGSTTINSAIAWRPDERVIERWGRDFGLGNAVTFAQLAPHFDRIEKDLKVRAVADDALGEHNRLFTESAAKLGIKAQRIQRYDGGCVASASCITGCTTGKKLGMNITHVPETLHLGGRIYTSAKVDRVEHRYGRAHAVHARFNAPGHPRLKVVARRGVVVAASAVQTPNLLRRSGLQSKAIGAHFQAHPGTSLAARFDRSISMGFGATQGANSTHFVDSDRFKIEALSLPPELAAVRVSGVGTRLMERLADYENILTWAVVVRAEAEGTVRSILGRDQVVYTPTPTDMARFRKAMRVLSEMMFAAGAKEVWPGIHGMPASLRSADELSAWDDASLDPRSYGLMASHLFGSARMGPKPESSVVGLDFQTHEVRGLYVVDSSVFPTNLGVNPQHTIMGVARLAAARILEHPLSPRG